MSKPIVRPELKDREAAEAASCRDMLLQELAAAMNRGLGPETPPVQKLIERYRREFIDRWLYPSRTVHFLGLSVSAAADPKTAQAYEQIAPGLADYLSRAFRSYYEDQHKKENR